MPSAGGIIGAANEGRRRKRGRETNTQSPSEMQRLMRRHAGRFKKAMRGRGKRRDRERSD